MELLYLIPARGGSKGIPGKNIKLLQGKPLIHYSIEFARIFTTDEHICISTDDTGIRKSVESIGLSIPFVRPDVLATDEAGSYEVIRHALSYYQRLGRKYDAIVLLQPTSPFREKEHLEGALQQYDETVDMIVSVIQSPYNPYFNLFEENKEGYLKLSKEGSFVTRQEAPPVYAYNGYYYIINAKSLDRHKSFSDFSQVRKYIMDAKFQIDLDTMEDWRYAEFLQSNR